MENQKRSNTSRLTLDVTPVMNSDESPNNDDRTHHYELMNDESSINENYYTLITLFDQIILGLGLTICVMEFISVTTLQKRLDKEGNFPVYFTLTHLCLGMSLVSTMFFLKTTSDYRVVIFSCVLNSVVIITFIFTMRMRPWYCSFSILLKPFFYMVKIILLSNKVKVFDVLRKHVDSIGIIVILNSLMYYSSFMLNNHKYGWYIVYNFSPIFFILISPYGEYSNTYRSLLFKMIYIGVINWCVIVTMITTINPSYLVPIIFYLCIKGYFVKSQLLSFQVILFVGRMLYYISTTGLTIIKCDTRVEPNLSYCESTITPCDCINMTQWIPDPLFPVNSNIYSLIILLAIHVIILFFRKYVFRCLELLI
jgi:hypothetical protein